MNKVVEQPDFWNDQEKAQKVLKDKKKLEDELGDYEQLEAQLEDIEILLALAEEEEDASLVSEIEEACGNYKEAAESYRIKTLLTGEYDGNNAILSVHGGSGGNDAKDWAEMLYRMYTRWAEQKGYKVKVMDYQDDEVGASTVPHSSSKGKMSTAT